MPENNKPKKLSPKEWSDKNIALGYKKVNTPHPTVYGVFYDPNKSYQQVDEKTMTVKDLPYITYDHPQDFKPAISPDHKPTQFGNTNYNPNTGQYIDPTSGKIIMPIVGQYKRGGKVKGYSDGTDPYGVTPAVPNGSGMPQQTPMQVSGSGNGYTYAFANANNNQYAKSVEQENQKKQSINPQFKQAATGALGAYGAAYHTSQALNETNQGEQVRDGVMAGISQAGPIGSVIGGVSAIGDQIGKPIREKSERVDENGRLLDKGKARQNYVIGSALSPSKAVGNVWGDKNSSAAEKAFVTALPGVGSAIYNESYANRLEKKAAENLNINAQNNYDNEVADNANKKAENDLAFGTYKDRILAERDAGIVDSDGTFTKPNKINTPVLQQYQAPGLNKERGGLPGYADSISQSVNGWGGGNNFAANGVEGVGKGYRGATNGLNNLGKKYFKDGGTIKGKGTGTSDSIKAKVKEGSFIVPAKNATAGKKALTAIGKNGEEEAENLNHKSGVDIKVSNGEVIFSPEEKNEIVNQFGEEYLEQLAPEAKTELREHFSKGGKVKDFCYSKGGDVKGYAKGTPSGGVGGYGTGGVDIEAIKAQIAQKESGGDSTAVNKTGSSAYGKYQFTKGTFKDTYKKVYGKELSDANYNKIKSDIAVQESLMTKLVRDNVDTLQKAGIEPTVQNIYAAHHFGAEGAIEMAKNPNAPVPDKVQKYNPVLKGKTNSEALDWSKNYINKDSKAAPVLTAQQQKDFNFYKSRSGTQERNVTPRIIDPLNPKATMPKIEARDNSYVPEHEVVDTSDRDYQEAMSRNDASQSTNSGVEDERFKRDYQEAISRNKSSQPDLQQKQYEDDMAARLAETNPTNSAPKGNGFDWSGLGSTILNYGVPLAQAYLGYKNLKEMGPRPVDHLDPTFMGNLQQTQNRVTQADLNAKYGLNPNERAYLDQQNAVQTNAARTAARNLAGGNSATALSLERAASNDAYGRNLSTTILDNNLKLQKQSASADRQSEANQMTYIKQNYNRMLFQDNLNAFQQKQQANAGLLNTGLTNLIGGVRYSDEKKAEEARQKTADNWLTWNQIQQSK